MHYCIFSYIAERSFVCNTHTFPKYFISVLERERASATEFYKVSVSQAADGT